MTLSVKFYTKPKCPLCEEVRVFLNHLKKDFPLEIEEVNILNNPDLYERYKYEIPVLLFPDKSQVSGKIDQGTLKAKLSQIFRQR